MRKITFFAWGAVLLAISAWVGVFLFAQIVQGMEKARAERMGSAESTAKQDSTTIRTHALARETQDLRQELDVLAQGDVLAMANAIEGVGKISGVDLVIANAIPDSAPTKANPNTLYGISFQVAAQGSYTALMHTVQLFENLPLLSSVDTLDLEQVGTSRNNWILTARIHVFSATPISS